LVTVTVTAPALPVGLLAVIVVLFTTAMLEAAVLPNLTVAPEAKLPPVIVTDVPPVVEPLFGDTLLIVGCVLVALALRLTVAVGFVAALLFTVNAPVLEPAAVGTNRTFSVAVCFGFRINGKAAPDNEYPVPLIDAELMVNAAVPVEVIVTGRDAFKPNATLPKFRAVELIVHCATAGVAGEPVPAENDAICMTHGPEEVNVAVALLLPAAVVTLSSTMPPSGEVMPRDVYPLPGAAVSVATVFAPMTNSLAR